MNASFDEIGGIILHGGRIDLQMGVEPREDDAAELGRVAMRGEILDKVETIADLERRVLAPSSAPVPFCPLPKPASDQIKSLSRSHSGSGNSQCSVIIMALQRRAT
jgi:hypothetical protein